MRELTSPDPEIREAAYTRIERDVGLGEAPVAEAAALADLLEEMLFDGIGNAGDDSVFGRSFAVLSLGICIYRDNNEPYLAQERWFELLGATQAYAHQEVDLRGWVDRKGWAHAAAHTADLVGRFAQSRYASPEATGPRLLAIVSSLLGNATSAFRWGEDERLARALTLVPRDGLDAWAEAEVAAASAVDWGAFDPVAFARRENLKLLLRALYFRLEGAENLRALSAFLVDF